MLSTEIMDNSIENRETIQNSFIGNAKRFATYSYGSVVRACPIQPASVTKKEKKGNALKADIRYNSAIEPFNIYVNSCKNSKTPFKKNEILDVLISCLNSLYPEYDFDSETAELYNYQKISNKNYAKKIVNNYFQNLYGRLLRYKKKCHTFSDQWNYFVTFTYDDEKFRNEDDFKKALKKTLNNFSTRRNWKIMLCFERGADTNRLHAHGILYVPKGQMVGDLILCNSWSYANRCKQKVIRNTFFDNRFGLSTFEKIDTINNYDTRENESVMHYIVKYVTKSGEKIFYSRGIGSYKVMALDIEDIAFVRCFRYGTYSCILFSDIKNVPYFTVPQINKKFKETLYRLIS